MTSSQQEAIENLMKSGDIEAALAALEKHESDLEHLTSERESLWWIYRKRAQCLFMMNRHREASEAAGRVLAEARNHEAHETVSSSLMILGVIHGELEDLQRARECFEQSYELRTSFGSKELGGLLNNLGNIELLCGRTGRAIEYFRQAADNARRNGDRWLTGLAKRNTGRALSVLGRHEEAIREHRKSIAIFETEGDQVQVLAGRVKLGDALEESGAADKAERLLRECVAEAEARGMHAFRDDLYGTLGGVLLRNGRWDEGRAMTLRSIEELEEGETFEFLRKVSQLRDQETREHLKRVGTLSKSVAALLGETEERQQELYYGSQLHDLGKLYLPDSILLKPGKLTEAEYERMKHHTVIGYELLKDAEGTYLQEGARIALSHHERWDGSGYPAQLSAESIPLDGRIVGLVDVFDALTSHRPYKKAWNAEESFEYVLSQRGRQFDPQLVDLFSDSFDQIRDSLGAAD